MFPFSGRRIRPLAAALITLIMLCSAAPALAHPAPSVLHDYVVSMSPTSLTIETYLRVSPELVPEVYRKIDTNNDGATSQDEIEAWVRDHLMKLQATLDEKPVKFSLSQAPAMGKADLLASIDHPIHVTYSAAWTDPISGKHRIRLTYGDNYIDYDEYYISVANDTANDSRPQQVSKPTYPANFQIVYHIPTPQEANNVPQGEIAPPPYYVGLYTPTPAPAATAEAAAAPVLSQPGGQSSFTGGILQSLRSWHGEFWSGLGLIALALLIGALHALTPGHGKAMVAAYLIGSKGRVRDAALLGGVVTFTHTVGVVLLGLVLLLVSNFTVPKGMQPTLELASGLLVILLGGYLLITRWRQAETPLPSQAHNASEQRTKRAGRAAGVRPAASTVAATAATAGQVSQAATQTLPVRLAASNGHSHETLPTTAAAHTHDHDHSHDHSHDHGHSHTHDGQTQAHSHALPQGSVSVRELVGLGISGGLVPCPDALAILLLAAGVGQFALGLGLVISFSVGLAAVLIGIGIALVGMKGALEKSRAASNLTTSALWVRWVPIASAVIVVAVGLVMTVSALGSL